MHFKISALSNWTFELLWTRNWLQAVWPEEFKKKKQEKLIHIQIIHLQSHPHGKALQLKYICWCLWYGWSSRWILKVICLENDHLILHDISWCYVLLVVSSFCYYLFHPRCSRRYSTIINLGISSTTTRM